MRPLHIVHTESSQGWGGQEIRILTEAQGMVARGHRITLITPKTANIYREGKARGLDVVALPIARKKTKGFLAMRRWLSANPVDVINTHSSTDAWLSALACRFMDNAPPTVRTRHISAPVPYNFATRWLYSNASRHIVTTGEKLRNELIDRNGFDPKRITSVPTGIDTQRFIPGERRPAREQLGLPADAKIIGIVATLRSWKGHNYLLDAFAALADKTTYLTIVGDGPQRQALQSQISRLGLGDRVVMAGNHENVVPWLQAIDVFALPSYANEGVPQAILQAMSCGIPVISTTVGSITEAVCDQETGIIIPPRNSAALTQALEAMLHDADMRLRYSDAARKMALEKFGLDIMLDKMEAIFQSVVHG
ncbi:MAG: glycosyltransferase family 4 protein [Pseudomonadota bacterium]